VRFFVTSNRDTYARDAFEAKREKETREYAHTRARAAKENIPSKITVTNTQREFLDTKKKKGTTFTREREREREREIERERENETRTRTRGGGVAEEEDAEASW
jgi:nitrogenase molybdenum-iron protein alpha/beta subunit